jgi:outer membrane protein assembly factor BamB
LALRASDGELLWQRSLTGDPSDRAPVIVGETVIVGRKTGEVYALAIRTGEPLWQVSLDGQPGSPLLTDGRVILGSTDNALYCLDERTGRLLWRWRTGGDVRAAPVVDATHIYYVSLDNMLRAIDRHSGNLRWKRGLAARATTGLQLVSDQLLVSGLAPQVRAHRITDGRPVGNLDVATDLLAVPPLLVPRPAPDYVLLVVAGRDGAIFAYRPTLSLVVTPLESLPGFPVELFAPDSVIEATSAPR